MSKLVPSIKTMPIGSFTFTAELIRKLLFKEKVLMVFNISQNLYINGMHAIKNIIIHTAGR